MTVLAPINPAYQKSVSLAVGTSSASVTIPAGSKSLQLVNSGTNIVFVRVGQGSIAASLTSPNADFPIGPNAAVVITKFQDDNVVAAISAAAGNTLWVTNGEGW